jgi:hypothetical protein
MLRFFKMGFCIDLEYLNIVDLYNIEENTFLNWN